SRLRRELHDFAQHHGLRLVLPDLAYCVDNAAMIAGLGGVLLESRGPDDLTLRATPTTAC
ncbi:MAG: tRNA (adenosine(37)-N6)-threonylcarbamoyltransferase complex transferase subunit TsaD, partial [Planctomycetota bacterium]